MASDRYILVLNHPESAPKDIGAGVLSVDTKGNAEFFALPTATHVGRVLAQMERVRLEFIAAKGMLLSGMEPGRSTNGRTTYTYQEWWLRYTHEGVQDA